MKKYLPIVGTVMVFSMFLASQVIFDLLGKSTPPTTKKEQDLRSHYKSVFSKIEFKSTDKKVFRPINSKAPVVILNFWASWCKPCLHEFPSLTALKKKYSDEEVFVFGINTDEENQLKKIKKVVNKYELNFPIIPDSTGKILEEFLITSIPVSIIFYRGEVIEITRGAKDFNSGEMVEKMAELIEKDKKSTI